jgi:hypothetical protein
LEGSQCILREDASLFRDDVLLVFALACFPGCPQLKTSASNLGLCIATSAMSHDWRTLLFEWGIRVLGRVGLADQTWLAQSPNGIEPSLPITKRERVAQFFGLLEVESALTDEINGECSHQAL